MKTHEVSVERAWEICPEAMVEFDRLCGHIENVKFFHWPWMALLTAVDLQILLTFVPDWPSCEVGHQPYSLCVDFIDGEWRPNTPGYRWILDATEYLRRRVKAYSEGADEGRGL